ncbi:Tetratricopeptide repeat-containing protein [Allopseudospirillum japonicum]|uniref:Tetratricopeptide repeat-containing protein n=1 Tax=Allopseudospirillum japonicum TaxID=64971 RepID=A0A1H6TJC5_9GAMM|nr:class I SAM-dependent methyltransferase [Allopseudospirillum japonicum]SEI78284.1 Tetratricopeptide repeat-containing protein [Allopseudospirillum japonicum]
MSNLEQKSLEDIYREAVRLHQAGELDEAGELYRHILDEDPNNGFAMHLLGVIALDQDMYDAAEIVIQDAIDLQPDLAEAYANLGRVQFELGKYPEAIENLEKAIGFKPELTHVFSWIGRAYNQEDESHKALVAFRHALKNGDDSALVWDGMAQALRNFVRLKFADDARVFDDALAKDLIQVTRLQLLDAHELVPTIARWVNQQADIQHWQSLLAQGDEAGLKQHLLTCQTLIHPLFRYLLEQQINKDSKIESLLLSTRALLLDLWQQDFAEDMQALLSALAQQMYLNEYIYPVSAHEEQVLAELRQAIAKGYIARQLPGHGALLLLAAYEPLHMHTWARDADLLKQLLLNPAMQPVLEQQILEPVNEIALWAQAENAPENASLDEYPKLAPSPRWQKQAFIKTLGLAQTLAKAFPHYEQPEELVPQTGTQGLALVVGCGTGQLAYQWAQRCPELAINAFDADLRALAYGINRKNQSQLDNLHFGCAPIEAMQTSEHTFQLIDASGGCLLNSLQLSANPARDLGILKQLLAQDGLLKLRLASEAGLAALRSGYQALNDAGSLEQIDLRQFRMQLLTSSVKEQQRISTLPEFFSYSGFKKLLQEPMTGLNLRDLQSILSELGLEFLGFEFPHYVAIFEDYQAWISSGFAGVVDEDPHGVNLNQWRRFEEKHPHLFTSGYEFWVRPIQVND